MSIEIESTPHLNLYNFQNILRAHSVQRIGSAPDDFCLDVLFSTVHICEMP